VLRSRDGVRRSGVFGARVARELFDETAARAGPPWTALARAGARSEASALAGPFPKTSTSAAAAAIFKAVMWDSPQSGSQRRSLDRG
jgi:hypothetical protein